jgi:hypothetical protein
MAKFKKKPVVIEATQWFKMGDHPMVEDYWGKAECHDYARNHNLTTEQRKQLGWVKTLEGAHVVCSGDWIITGVKGENYPCKPDIFEMTYEPVE